MDNTPGTDLTLVPVTFLASYRGATGPQFNAGESAGVPAAEADLLIMAGAAVRMTCSSEEAAATAKGLAHPIQDKMMKEGATK
jgi:hypothetical protein